MQNKKIIGLVLGVCFAFLLTASTASAENAGAYPNGQAYQNSMNSGSSGSSLASNTTGSGWSLSSVSSFGLPSGTVTGIVTNVLMWLLFMLGIVGVIGFVISGIMYLISTGDQTMIDRAKKGMTYSIVGIIVGLAGVVIIQAVEAILNGIPNI